MDRTRIVFLDWLRVTACLMVIITHCTEPFYLGGAGTYMASASDAWWCSIINALVRSCVPLFVLTSSYLLFPVKVSTLEFFKKRAVRVLIPLLAWVLLYAVCFPVDGGIVPNLKRLLFNFPDPAGHLWFVYMLLGVYILMPLLSPWAEKASKSELQLYLGIWAFTLIIPFIRQASVALTGTWSVWGEANWNEFGTFYYISGFIGYLLLGLYIRKFVGELSLKRTMAISLPCFILGFAIAVAWFRSAIVPFSGSETFPIDSPISLAVNMETSWRFCSLGVALMTFGLFMMFRTIKAEGNFYKKLVLPVSKASYGMYLMHMFILLRVHAWLRPLFESSLPAAVSTPVCIITAALATYVLAAVIACALQRIPKLGKWIVG